MLFQIDQARCRINRHDLFTVERFAVNAGEHWCVFGPNGAGKSLLVDLITGRRPETGSYLRFAGGFDPVRDILSVSFEEQQRLWRRDERLDISDFREDAIDQGTLVAELIRSSLPAAKQDESRLRGLAAELDLTALLQKGIRFLSSGQIRRALIARALYGQYASRPRLLIFDEPLEAVDRESRARIEQAIAGHLGPGCASLHLCRRGGDRFPGATHLLVMENLGVLAQGPMREARWQKAIARFRREPVIPERLPFAHFVDETSRKKSRKSRDTHPKIQDTHSPDTNQDTHPPESKLIELKGVSAGYGDLQVLRDVHWTMTSAHHVLVEGPNGCGKSTLLSLIDGENHKGYGQEVYLFGRRKGSGETVWDIKRCFGVVSNELHNRYVKGWKVLDVAVSGFFDSVGLYDDSAASEQGRAGAWLESLGMAHLAGRYYHQISFGQQRLVLLARAMVKQPAILVLDEPCVGLDDYHRDFVLGMLDAIAGQTPTRLIYVSHIPDEKPACINYRLRFVATRDGGYRLEQSEAGQGGTSMCRREALT